MEKCPKCGSYHVMIVEELEDGTMIFWCDDCLYNWDM